MVISKEAHVKEIEKLNENHIDSIRRLNRRTILTVMALLVISILGTGFLFNKTINSVKRGQIAACYRGNDLRAIIASGNEIEITQIQDEIDALDKYPDTQKNTKVFKALRKSKIQALEDRVSRRDLLNPFPCETLR